jgi:hypothetical protein
MRNDDHHYSPKKRYFAVKQLYHFVRPGARRVATSSDASGLITSAFLDSSADSLIVVGVKQGGPSQVQITIPSSKQAPAIWELYQTTRTLDCHQTGSFAATNGVVQLELPDEAIFTLVGKARNP